MKIRAYESVTIQIDGVPVIEGHTLGDWKALLAKGIQRNVSDGRNLYDWDHHESTDTYGNTDRWKKVGPQLHEIDGTQIDFYVYRHGGKIEMQAVYFFDVDNSAERL